MEEWGHCSIKIVPASLESSMYVLTQGESVERTSYIHGDFLLAEILIPWNPCMS